MLRRLIVRMVLLVVLGLAFATASALPAGAQPTATAELGESATLAAKGVLVEVPVIYSCSPDAVFHSSFVQLIQRVGNNTARGFGDTTDLTCDGSQHTVLLTVMTDDIRFRKGIAFAQGEVFACDEFGLCVDARFSGTIEITHN